MNKTLFSTRREFLRKSACVAAAASILPLISSAVPQKKNSGTHPASQSQQTPGFQLPPLPYAYDALEPFIDTETMRIHHDKHHQAYVSNLNKAIHEYQLAGDLSLDELIREVGPKPAAFRNNAGGHWNHTIFWDIMKPGGKKHPEGELLDAIHAQFDDIEDFRRKFATVALSHFGSGWAWLVVTNTGRLNLFSLPNQDNPLMDIAAKKGTPILCLDVWEHAYYLKYQNLRNEYVDAWWKVVNWDEVMKRYQTAKK
ncbi:MAG: superoxide dismutase [Bacteroidia bacterium]|nr:superoxide dismutase [Bacteroidia bacterium]MCZ2276361.1 superoxide dismutase [Bacteroidia bacterium]